MTRERYFYNPGTLKFEKVKNSWKRRILRAIAFLSTAIVFAVIIIALAYRFLDSPKEKQLRREIEELSVKYEVMGRRADLMQRVLKDLKDRDNNIYRVIFEAEPISELSRSSRFQSKGDPEMDTYKNAELMKNLQSRLDTIQSEMYVQSKSYDEVFQLAKGKEQMMSSIPAIQPVSNKFLKQIASGFGYRIHPIYKTVKLHEGLDFTASIGTPIYATGNGVVVSPRWWFRLWIACGNKPWIWLSNIICPYE